MDSKEAFELWERCEAARLAAAKGEEHKEATRDSGKSRLSRPATLLVIIEI
jgi:hypothetical protein